MNGEGRRPKIKGKTRRRGHTLVIIQKAHPTGEIVVVAYNAALFGLQPCNCGQAGRQAG